MSNNGYRPVYPRRIYKPQQSNRLQSGFFVAQGNNGQPGYSQLSGPTQPSLEPQYGYMREQSDMRFTDQPSATFSRANRDRGLSNVFRSNTSDSFRRPSSNAAPRLPQSSAGYQDVSEAVPQDMSISDEPTDAFYHDRPFVVYAGTSRDRHPTTFMGTRRPPPAYRQMSVQSNHHPVTLSGSDPVLQLRYRRIADALAEEGINFPSDPSQLTADHAIQAFAHLYGLFLPMPPDFPELDPVEENHADRLKSRIDAVNGLLEDLCYEDRRQTIAEMANLSLIAHPHRTVSALFWLMQLAGQARLAVPQSERDEVPPMDQSLEYAEYAFRMLFASSLSKSPGVTVPEARAYIDGALARFQSEKEQAIAKHRADIDAIKYDQAEVTRTLESESTQLAELESRRNQLEARKRELVSNLASLRSSFSSLQAEAQNKSSELEQARFDFEGMKAKLVGSGVESPQEALQLANQLRSQQIQLEQLEAQLERAQSTLMSEKGQSFIQQLDTVRGMASSYNEDISASFAFPDLPETVREALGKSASEILSAQSMLSISEQWKRATQEEETKVLQLQRLVREVKAKTKDLDEALAVHNQETAQLAAGLEQVLSAFLAKQKEAQQLQNQLRAREEQLHDHQPQENILERQGLLHEMEEQLKTSEAKNKELESKMRQCADRKREIRVLLETYKAAYARIVESIGQRESAIRQHEKTVNNLQKVLLDFTPPSARKSGP